ncbi:MAG: hypothetical protein V4658_02205, partial [Bacteroidota bacterium]
NNSLVVYTSLPNGTSDSYPRNDTMKMNFTAPLKGVYIIGTAPSDFASFNAAAAALRSGGVSGHVFFDVKTGIYNEQLSFYEKVRGASDTS